MKSKWNKYHKDVDFSPIDTTSIPHPYCIGSKHIEHAAKFFCNILNKESIRSGEKRGIKCKISGCQLSWDEHERAILISCPSDFNFDDKDNLAKLQVYLLKIKEQTEADGFSGFVFKHGE